MILIIFALLFSNTYMIQKYENRNKEVMECINDQVDLYGDLCAESFGNGDQSNYEGVKCAVESIKICLGEE